MTSTIWKCFSKPCFRLRIPYETKYHGRRKKFLARGHGDADYQLTPTIFRRPKGEVEGNRFDGFVNEYIHGASIEYEASLFSEFLSGLNYSSALLSDDCVALLQSHENFANTEVVNILGPQPLRRFGPTDFPSDIAPTCGMMRILKIKRFCL